MQHDGAAIRERRERLGLSARALAEKAQVDRQTVASLESTGRSRTSTFRLIERALEVAEAEAGLTPQPETPPEQKPVGTVEFILSLEGEMSLTIKGNVEHAQELSEVAFRMAREFGVKPEPTVEA